MLAESLRSMKLRSGAIMRSAPGMPIPFPSIGTQGVASRVMRGLNESQVLPLTADNIYQLQARESAIRSAALSSENFLSLLPLSFDPSIQKASLPFAEFCNALETINSNRSATRDQIEILTQMFSKAISIASSISNPDVRDKNVALEIYLILKMLLPHRDHSTIYGMKTHRLLKVISSVLKNQGRVDSAAKIEQWIQNPIPQLKLNPSASGSSQASGNNYGLDVPEEEYEEEFGSSIIFAPEIIAATLCSSIAKSGGGAVTLQDVGALCRSLTNAYLRLGSQEIDTSQNLESAQKNMLVEVSKYFTFNEWIVLCKIILKRVTMGVGQNMVLNCVPYIEAALVYPKRYDLQEIAKACVSSANVMNAERQRVPMADPQMHHYQNTEKYSHVECGIPFVPMTCHTMRSPYMMNWLFSREDTLEKPMKPKDGRLIILSNGEWYVPLNSRLNKRFVNIQSKEMTRNPTRRKYILFMREFHKVASSVLNVEHTRGLVLHHTLSEEKGDRVLMLVRSVSDAAAQGAEIISESSEMEPDAVLLDERVEEEEEGELLNLKIQANVQALLQKICNEDKVVEIPRSRYKLQVAASKRKPKKNAKKKTNLKLSKLIRSKATGTQNKKTMEIPTLRRSLRIQNKSSADVLQEPDNIELADDVIEVDNAEESIMVQTKYDGDRLQAHIKDAQNITLFTKWGKDVSDIYSNVRDDLSKLASMKSISPCILDGEIIVVDHAENPIPWSSEKWRYNHAPKTSTEESNESDARVQSLYDFMKPSAVPEEESMIATMLLDDVEQFQEDEYANDGNLALTFLTKKGMQKWNKNVGPQDQKEKKVRIIPNAKLCFIVFDIIMYNGKPVHDKPCRERLDMIVSTIFKKEDAKLKYVRSVENTKAVNKVSELLRLLKESTENKEEGLVLKDPSMEYVFGKTKAVQKLKLAGPDINTLVCGAGASLSKNPRMWGLLTAVGILSRLSEEEDDSDVVMVSDTLISYCRTEVIEGDRPWKALRIVMSLPSKITKSQVMACNQRNPSVRIETDSYDVEVRLQDANAYEIKWKAKNIDNAHLNCTIILRQTNLIDIQWIVNPLELKFGLSLKGDLRPITEKHEYYKVPPFYVELMIPRHPVARIEFAEFQMSSCDTNASIAEKFEEAQVIRDCIEKYTTRRIQRMREMPPTRKNLEEIRRTVIGITEEHQNPNVRWPQPSPSASMSINDLSNAIQRVGEIFLANIQDKSNAVNQAVKRAFRKLEPESRLVLAGSPSYSQWKKYRKISSVNSIQNIDDAMESGSRISNLPMLLARMKELKSIQRPVFKTQSAFQVPLANPEDIIIGLDMRYDYSSESDAEAND